jgi:hypothetical protein
LLCLRRHTADDFTWRHSPRHLRSVIAALLSHYQLSKMATFVVT